MNEDFLQQFQRRPSANLLKKIHARLERKERIQAIRYQFARSALVLLFTFGMLITLSSKVRASVIQTVKYVLQRDLMLCNWSLNTFWTSEDLNIFYCDGGNGVLATNPGQNLSLEDAQVLFASSIALPTYVPERFERLENIEFFDLPDQPALAVTWNRENHYSRIKLLISHHSMPIEEYAQTLGEGAIEETTLGVKPAIIVRGTWNIGTQENDFMMTALMWRYDHNTVYSLMSLEQAIPLDELIKMAESIP
ncbi:MAG: hypothetical protein IT312_01190 [Anaerolineales bacterium]|nr:hypothetical protein [Anaerolineales bacterium]